MSDNQIALKAQKKSKLKLSDKGKVRAKRMAVKLILFILLLGFA